MQTLVLENPIILTRICQLAQEMCIPETDVIEKAVDLYAKNIRKKKKLISFAGALTPKDGEDILNSINNSRMDKDMEIKL
ncbi:MAG: hypothetical protein AB7S75_16790 [Desulfococcaceae bacterium]